MVKLNKFNHNHRSNCVYMSVQRTQDHCLSYIDTSVKPPVWKCQDDCLTQVSPSFWCGETDHFTNFAVLLSGSKKKSSTTTKIGKNCDNSSNDYFAGSALADGLIYHLELLWLH
jgi:hypothetical protein